MEDTDCICTKGETVHYAWAGTDIVSKSDEETWAHAIAEWFAEKAANEEFHKGNLDSRRFNKFKMRTAAFVEEKMDRLVQGRLSPGTEVVCVKIAMRQELPIFELRWHRQESMLKHNTKELIRQYEGEPFEDELTAFGLHMHLKDATSGDDDEINRVQDSEMLVAMNCYHLHQESGWPEAE